MMRNPRETLRLRTSSEEATLALGQALGAALMEATLIEAAKESAPGMTVLLSGDLGTGKTTLVRGIGGALGVTRVRSPSFTLINEYQTADFLIAHADLYRLEPGEAEDLGLEEYREAPCLLLVEWAERWTGSPELGVFNVFIESVGENERAFEISSLGGAAGSALQKLREAVEGGEIDSGVGLQLASD